MHLGTRRVGLVFTKLQHELNGRCMLSSMPSDVGLKVVVGGG